MNELEKTIEAKRGRVEELRSLSAAESVLEEIRVLEGEISEHLAQLDPKKIEEEIASIDKSLPLGEAIEKALKSNTQIEKGEREISEKAESLISEMEAFEDPLEEGIQKEIDPLLKILCSESDDFSAFREQVLSDLSDSVVKMNNFPGSGIAILPPDRVVAQMKELLSRRMKAIIEDSRNYDLKKKPDDGLIRASKIALISDGDFSDLKTYSERDCKEMRFESVSNYLRQYTQSQERTCSEKEIVELLKTPLREGLARSEPYEIDRYVKGAPAELFVAIAEEPVYSYSLVDRLLEKCPSDKPLNKEALEVLCGYAYTKSVQSMIERFEPGLFEKTIDTYSLNHPHYAGDMVKNMQKAGYSPEKQQELIRKIVQHQDIGERDCDVPLIRKQFGDVIEQLKRLPNGLRRGNEEVEPSEEDLVVAKKIIEEGNVGFLSRRRDCLDYLLKTDPDWVIGQARKYDQEHLLIKGAANYKMKQEDQQQYADRLIEKEKAYVVNALTLENVFSEHALSRGTYEKLMAKNFKPALKVFQGLPSEIAFSARKYEEKREVLNSLPSFENLDQEKLVNRYMDQGSYDLVAGHISRIDEAYHDSVAHRLIDQVRDDWNGGIVSEIRNFKNVKPDVAFSLVEKGKAWAPASSPESFPGLDHPTFVEFLLAKNHPDLVARNIARYKHVDHLEIARKIYAHKADGKVALVQSLGNFKNLDASLAFDLVKDGYASSVDGALVSFDGVNIEKLAEAICDSGKPEVLLASYYQRYASLGPDSRVYQSIDSYLRDNLAANVSKVEQLPSTSFFSRNKEFFVEKNALTEKGRIFSDLLKDGLFSMSDSDIVTFSEYIKDIRKFDSSPTVIKKYCQLQLEGKHEEAGAYKELVSAKVSQLAKLGSIEAESAEEYADILKAVYPERNYNAYKSIGSYEDRTKDLEKYIFSREGYDIAIDGVIGYKLKDGQVADEKVMKDFSRRIENIKNISTEESFDDFLVQEIDESKAVTTEGKILEYFKHKGYSIDTMNVLLAYQLKGTYNDFVAESAGRVSQTESDVEKNFILLDELANRYGDSMKETIKAVQEAVSNSSDKELFAGNTVEEHGQAYGILAETIIQDLEKIPRDKISNDTIQKKIAKTIKNTFQNVKDLQARSKHFAELFTENDLDNFGEVWKKRMDQLFAVSDAYAIDMKKIEAMQSSVYHTLQTEISKYEEIREVDQSRDGEIKSAKQRTVKGYFAKNKETALARMVGDICLATDANMLKNENYFEFVLMDSEREKCMGTTMLYNMEEPDGKKYLLYCPNPSVGLVSEVSAKKLYKKMTDQIKEFAEQNKFTAVVVDKTHGKSTNRAGLFQNTLDQSCLKDSAGREIRMDFENEYLLGGGYKYQKNLQVVWKK